MTSYVKDPDAVLNYRWDWAEFLGDSDTITASEMITETGIVVDSDDNDTTSATVVLSGGTVGETYEVTNRITTAAGLVNDHTIRIRIEQR